MVQLIVNDVNINDFMGEDNFVLNEVNGRGPISRTVSSIDVPAMDGAHFRRVNSNIRVLEMDFTLKGRSLEELRDKVNRLNGLINYDKPVPIRFTDEPTKSYYGVSVGEADFDEVRSLGQGKLVFNCYDPHKYGEEEYKVFNGGEVTVVNEGNVATKPRFETKLTQDITHLDFIRKETGEYMRLGDVSAADVDKYEPVSLVWRDDCEDTSGWATASDVDNGYVSGEMVSNGDAFVVDTFGGAIEPHKFQGPSLKRGIGESLDDFYVDIYVENFNVESKTGMIEMYLLDVDNNVVGKVGLEDRWDSLAKNVAKFQLGEVDVNRHNYTREPDVWTGWNNFKGMLRFVRDSRKGEIQLYPYFTEIDPITGKHHSRSYGYRYTDYAAEYNAPVTQIQVAMRVWPLTDATDMRIKKIEVYKLNSAPTSESIPYLARAGDTLVVDHATEEILVNGESVKDSKDFGANFFALPPGVSEVVQSPSGVGNTTVYWRSKYR